MSAAYCGEAQGAERAILPPWKLVLQLYYFVSHRISRRVHLDSACSLLQTKHELTKVKIFADILDSGETFPNPEDLNLHQHQ